MEIRIVHVLIAVAVLLVLSMFVMAYVGTDSNAIYWLLATSALINIVFAIILNSKNKKNK